MAATQTESAIRRSIDRIAGKSPDSLTQVDLDRLTGWVEHPSPAIRAAAVEALQAFGDEWDLVEPVSDLLTSETDPGVRAAVLDTLAFFGVTYQEDADAVAELEDRDPNYEEDTPEGYEAIRRVLRERADDEQEAEPVRAAALVAMGDLSDDPVVREVFIPYLDAPQPAMRAAAFRAVGFSEDATGVEEKILAAIDAPETEVRAQAMIAAGTTRLEAAADRIRPLVDSPDPVLRAAAWFGFAGCADVEEADQVLGKIGETITEADPLYDDYQEALEELEARFEDEEDVGDELDADERQTEREIDQRVGAFVRAESDAGTPDEELGEAQFAAETFLDYLLRHEETPPAQVTRTTVREYLLRFFPRKIATPLDQEPGTPGGLARYLRYLGRSGELADADALARYAISLDTQFRKALQDPTNWGLAKTIMMQAIEQGVDPTDEDAMQAFLDRFNAQMGR